VMRQLLYGLALVLIMLVRPAGVWPSPNRENRPNAALARDEEKEAVA
jgi:branched-chain amino acid transport system permease protein